MSTYKVAAIHAMTPIDNGLKIEPKPIRKIMGRSYFRTELDVLGNLDKYKLVIEFQHWIPSFARILK